MASIIGKRIREVKSREKEKPLIFQPRTKDLETALERHNEAYKWLGMDKKREVSPKLWRDAIDLLTPIKTIRDREKTFQAFIADEWTNPKYRSKSERQEIQSREERETDTREFNEFFNGLKVSGIFEDYSLHHSSTKLLPKFPGDLKLVKEIQFQTLNSGTKDARGNDLGLYLDEMSKVPKPFYKSYMESLTQAERAVAKKLVRHHLDLSRYGKLWDAFLKSQGITIKDMDHAHCEYYPSWRKTYRLPGHGAKDVGNKLVGVASITKEVQFFKQACRYALVKKIISSDPSLTLKVEKKERKLTDKEKPLDLTTLNRLLSYLDKTLESLDDPDFAGRGNANEEAELNIKSIYFILLTGCRPSEIKNYVIDGDQLHFNIDGTGKTKQATRALPLSPRLREIAEDPILEQNKETPDVSTRIYQWLRRRKHKINPYRLRHTCATILLVVGELPLQEIAYRMGHSDAGFTQRVYGNMGVHLKKGSKGAVKKFWKEFNGEIED
jgi:site-specific recombinase XerD